MMYEGFQYDKQGNITYLSRWDNQDSMDQLQMTYNGNQLKKVTDNGISQNLYSIKEYKDLSNLATEFYYDANGNMITDLDRDIVTIKYNLLNLPDLIQFKNGCQIKHTYSAGGQKLSSRYITVNTGVYQPLNPGQVINQFTPKFLSIILAMRIFIITIELFLFTSCINQKQFLHEVIQNPQETTYTCINKHVNCQYNGFVIINSEVKTPQVGVINVSISFGNDIKLRLPLKINSVEANWIRIKDSQSDSIIINQSIYGEVDDLTLLRYKNELLFLIKDCNCTVSYFNENFIPNKISYNFKFVVVKNL